MKRLLYKLGTRTAVTAVMLLLVLSPFQALMAQAQTNSSTNCTSTNSATCIQSGPTTVATAPTASNTSPAATPAQVYACNITSPSSYDLCISNVVYVFTVGIGSGFAYVAAYFFDLAIQLSLNGTAYALTFISTGWTTARDLANMAFLFILLFIAFQIMFSAETANTQSVLAAVIVVALLVNFSFFFTRLVIDAGNILSIEFYNSIQAPPVSASQSSTGTTIASGLASATGSTSFNNTKDLTASIMNMLQVQNIFSTNSFNQFYKNNTGISGFLVVLITLTFIYIAAAMIFWAIAVTFVSVGIKFLVRIVVLWFLIIFSPLAFVARAVPQFRGYYDMWQKELVKTAFYPVAFMFIFLILVNFTNQIGTCTITATTNSGSCLLADIFASIPTTAQNANTPFLAILGVALANIAIRLGFVLAILYMGMKASESFSVMGASTAQKGANWLGGKAVQYSSASLGFAGRQTLGRGFKNVSNNPSLNAKAQQTGVFGGLWRGAQNTTKRLANATYDVRNAPGASVLKRTVTSSAIGAVNTGTAATKGYVDRAKERAEKQKKDKADRAAIIRDEANRKALEQIDKDIKAGARVPHARADVDRVKNMNKREIEALKPEQLVSIAHLLKESQNKTIQDSDKFTDEEKETIKKIAEPNFKSQDIVVDELRKLNSNLITMTSTVVDTGTARDAVVDQPSVVTMTTDLNAKLGTLRTNLATAPAGAAEDIKSDMNHIRKAIKSLRDLDRNLNNVPAQGKRNAKEIIAN